MLIQFTLQDLMLFLVCALGIVAGLLLLPILWNIKKVVGILKPLVETNQEFIKNAVRTMPVIFDNVRQISSNVRDTSDMLKISVPVILQEVEGITSAAKGSLQLAGAAMDNMSSGVNETETAYKKETPGFMAYFQVIEEVVQILYRTFSSSK